MTFASILAMLLSLHAPESRAVVVARAIHEAANGPREAAVLSAISLHENSVGAAGVPFGAMACRHRPSQRRCARMAVRILRRSWRICGERSTLAMRLGFYHTGRCREDAFARREARTAERLLRE